MLILWCDFISSLVREVYHSGAEIYLWLLVRLRSSKRGPTTDLSADVSEHSMVLQFSD